MTDKKKGRTPKDATHKTYFEPKTKPTGEQPIKLPPANTLHVNRWSELPDCIDLATYDIQEGDEVRSISLRKKTRQVLEGLINQPVACASKCRISDRVLILRRDHGLDIEMKMFDGKEVSDGESFGVYFLKSDISRSGATS